jgi:DNA repair protein RadC
MDIQPILEVVKIKQLIRKTKHPHTLYRIGSPDDVVPVIRKEIEAEDREVFLVIGLNTKNEVICIHRCHVGSINSSIVHPREVFKSLILNNAASFICAHNHPSGHSKESREDIEVTRRLIEAGLTLGIELLDHIIVGHRDWTSLKSKGFI